MYDADNPLLNAPKSIILHKDYNLYHLHPIDTHQQAVQTQARQNNKIMRAGVDVNDIIVRKPSVRDD